MTVLSEGIPAAEQPGTRNTFILVGSKRRFDFSPVTSGYDQRVGLSALTPTQMETLQRKARNQMLTDDWAPVENLLAPVVLRASRETAASQLVSRARALLRAGKPERADRMAERATRTSPELASAHDMRARTLVATGNKDAAVHELRVFTELRPSDADAWYRLGVLLADRKRLPEAVRAYDRAIALRPMHLESHNDLGIALVGVGRLSDGIAQFEQILRVDANHVKARQNLEIARRQADR